MRRRREFLSLRERYRFPIFSNGYILENKGEPFRIPHGRAPARPLKFYFVKFAPAVCIGQSSNVF